jgi:hypothetical protein
VPVVQVGIVRMLMREDVVAVFMRVGLRSVPRKIVLVLMMCVVDVRMRVREWMEALELVTTGSCLDRDNSDHAGESRLGPHG